jgi:hypothetical protein
MYIYVKMKKVYKKVLLNYKPKLQFVERQETR